MHIYIYQRHNSYRTEVGDDRQVDYRGAGTSIYGHKSEKVHVKVNNSVLSLRLKALSEGAKRVARDRLFQIVGAAIEKAFLADTRSWSVGGMDRSLASEDGAIVSGRMV